MNREMNRFEPFVKKWSPEYSFFVEPARVAAFAKVMGLPERARATLDDVPTFLTIFRDREFEILASMSLELKNVLHADQEYAWSKPIAVGTTVTYRSQLREVNSKRGRGMTLHFLAFETEVMNDVGEIAGHCRSTILYREAAVEPVVETLAGAAPTEAKREAGESNAGKPRAQYATGRAGSEK